MVNFNTNEIKFCIARASCADATVAPLPDKAVSKFRECLLYCADRNQDMLVIAFFPKHFLSISAFTSTKALLEARQVDFLHTLSDLLVLRTSSGSVITVKIASGSILFDGNGGMVEQEANDNMIQETPSSVAHAPTTGKHGTHCAGKQTSGVSAFGVPYTHPSPQTTPHVRNTKRSPKKHARPLNAADEEDNFGELTQECHGLLDNEL